MPQRIKIIGGLMVGVLVALCALGGYLRNTDGAATRTPTTVAAAPPPTQTAPAPSTATPTARAPAETPPPPAATAAPEQRYIAIAQDAALADIRAAMGVPAGAWTASVIDLGAGPELELRMPLNPAGDNAQFVRLAKQTIAQVINALFVDDPALARVVVIGTFPDQAGESPAVSIAVKRGAASWGSATVADIEAAAEFVNVKPEYR